MAGVVTHDHVWVRIEIYTAKSCSESARDNQILCYSILFMVFGLSAYVFLSSLAVKNYCSYYTQGLSWPCEYVSFIECFIIGRRILIKGSFFARFGLC